MTLVLTRDHELSYEDAESLIEDLRGHGAACLNWHERKGPTFRFGISFAVEAEHFIGGIDCWQLEELGAVAVTSMRVTSKPLSAIHLGNDLLAAWDRDIARLADSLSRGLARGR